ncbi:hypothetical protein PHLGIDRAFT_114115 [Phlebiopsis gigantea 11061_1 CR5-6]|uniref:DRBM domain-containing protein n=1 Tax=Phlebiopsis gigantea (strain 11061_1 CR5-6) TaxID=745531 RepID=A0A0C3PVW0_PHLG1|nr:hypothetical protein PHLGIDRAFT_114115 [Phlebiopsis gigantea 11061_1 CR5-6]
MDISTPPPLPTLPKLTGEIILEVFTHRSLRFPGAPIDEDSEHGDNERLAVLGEKVLEAAVTDTLFRKRPMLKGSDIEKRRKELLSAKNIEQWIVGYKLRDKLRCSPDAVQTLQEPLEILLLFNSYVGAVYATQGMHVIVNWVGALVDPDYVPASQSDVDMDPLYNAKKFKLEQFSPALAATPEPMIPPPPPPLGPPPPLPLPPMMSNPLAPAQPNTAFLPLFNQTANQRRMFVEYPAQFSGPAHAGKWNVKCVVNGIEKGSGAGASKQLAKEEAARQAYFAMGWAPRSS